MQAVLPRLHDHNKILLCDLIQIASASCLILMLHALVYRHFREEEGAGIPGGILSSQLMAAAKNSYGLSE